MSKEIICPECQATNTPGSKFCNNCGNRLPPSTSLICPNCKTPNPRDRFYCDNCGSRLVQDTQIPKEPEEKPKPDTGSFFSLPARPPGQTGELDPLQIVPDWLKKQAEESQEAEDEEDLRLRMPKIEGIGSEKKVTDDLPDWLVDEEDPEPIIGSPRIITTEHFMNLVQSPEDEREDDDLTQAADRANLPDWLSDITSPAAEDKAIQSDDLSTPDDALQEWLASISGSDQTEAKPAEVDDLDDLEGQLAGLSQSGDLAADWLDEEAVDEELSPDWLMGATSESSDAGLESEDADWEPPDTDSLSSLEADDQAMGGEVFDWLTENLVGTGMLDASAVVGADEPVLDESDDWLTDFVEEADEEQTLPDAVADTGGDLSDWLDVDEGDETEASDWAGLTEVAAEQDMAAHEQELPDWLTEITGEEEDEAEETPALSGDLQSQVETAVPPTSEPQPDWMAEFTTADSETFAEEIEAKLEALEGAESAGYEEREDEASEPIADFTGELKSWFEEDETAEPDELPETAVDAAEPESLPDWLSDMGADETLITESSESEDIFTDLFAPSPADSGILDWINGEEPEAEQPPAVEEAPEEPLPTPAEVDWFSEMLEMGDDAFAAEAAEDEAEITDQPEPTAAEPETAGADLFEADWPDEEPDEDEAKDIAEPKTLPSDLFDGDTILAEALGDELPDWLEELGPPASSEETAELDAAIPSGENMPEWIAQMKPASDFSGSGLTDSSGLPDLADSYPDIPEGLVGAELPDWLQDADEIAAEPMPALEESEDIPDWLADSAFSDQAGRARESDDEWTAVFQNLPPAAPIEERVFKADIPDWILTLKPGELTEEAEEEAPVQEGGPLAGIRDVIEIEPVITQIPPNGATPAFTVSQEQLSQATLLKQLALADKGTAQSFDRIKTSSLGVVRLLLAGLLLAVVVLGLLRPNLIQLNLAAVPPYLATAHDAIEAAAGEPVLVAVEYTPALSGELDAQAEMLLAQLAANDSPVVTVSQLAAGTAVTQRIAGEHPTLGLLTGQSVGLRQLGHCLDGQTSCDTLAGKTLPESLQQLLPDVALIIVLTGERDSLVGWLEQVTVTTDIPTVAGVTQSLAPVALPYLDTAQLQGMIGGLPETAVYQQELLNQTPDDAIIRQLSAQTLAQLLAAVLLLVGGLIFGVYNLLKRGGES